eukprot:snap_masked-scaffold_81-processed-gene-0.11-mRNA-1 protein AED:1.00 eAED:1.00 QI:0/-1/0/0/-1/1/1/0/93
MFARSNYLRQYWSSCGIELEPKAHVIYSPLNAQGSSLSRGVSSKDVIIVLVNVTGTLMSYAIYFGWLKYIPVTCRENLTVNAIFYTDLLSQKG